MPLLQVRNFPSDLYEQIKIRAKQEGRTISQQVIVMIKDALENEGPTIRQRLEALEKKVDRIIFKIDS